MPAAPGAYLPAQCIVLQMPDHCRYLQHITVQFSYSWHRTTSLPSGHNLNHPIIVTKSFECMGTDSLQEYSASIFRVEVLIIQVILRNTNGNPQELPNAPCKWEVLLIYFNQKIWSDIKICFWTSPSQKFTTTGLNPDESLLSTSHRLLESTSDHLPLGFSTRILYTFLLIPIQAMWLAHCHVLHISTLTIECGLHKPQQSDHKLLSKHISLGPCAALGSPFSHIWNLHLPSRVLHICFWEQISQKHYSQPTSKWMQCYSSNVAGCNTCACCGHGNIWR